MTFYQSSLVAMCAVVSAFGISHVYRFAVIYRRTHFKYLYLGLTAFGIALFQATQLMLSTPAAASVVLQVHRLKIVSVAIIVYCYLNTISVIAAENPRSVRARLLPFFVPVLAIIPFDFFLSYPTRSLVVSTPLGDFRYAYAQTHIGYTAFSILIVILFSLATVRVARSKAMHSRRFYATIMLLPVPVAANDFLVVHGVYRSVALSEFYFFALLFMVSFAFLREERDNQSRLENINAELDQRIRDRTLELERANLQLLAMATSDMLTGLDNRQKLMTRLKEEVARFDRHCRQGRDPFSVIFIDLDNFKIYNDTFGHRAGDFLLKQFAELLRHTARASDIVARFGGDEFVVVLPETLASGAVGFARRVYETLSKRGYFQDELCTFLGHVVELPAESTINCSMGIATYLPHMDMDTLLANADRALYEAKRKGKRGFALWQDCSTLTQQTALDDSAGACRAGGD